MNSKEIAERKQHLALQGFYLKAKQLIEELEKKHLQLIYNNPFRKGKGVNDFEKENQKRNDVSL